MSHFTIDFFELSFLAEACIPQPTVPIARSMFWKDMIDKHYHNMTPDERSRLFEWMQLNSKFKDQLEKGNKDVVLFYDRYNPDNQYRLFVSLEGYENGIEVFKNEGKYKTHENTSIVEEYITKIEKI